MRSVKIPHRSVTLRFKDHKSTIQDSSSVQLTEVLSGLIICTWNTGDLDSKEKYIVHSNSTTNSPKVFDSSNVDFAGQAASNRGRENKLRIWKLEDINDIVKHENTGRH